MSNPWAKVGGADFDADKEAKAQQEALDNLKGDDHGDPTFLRPNKGLTVLMVLPSSDDKFTNPFRDFLYHWGPNHACLRKDPVRIAGPAPKYEEDKRFSSCPRCLGAWNAWDAVGKPKGDDPQFAKFKYDMSNHSGLAQAIDLTPFFQWDDPKDPYMAEPNKKALKEWYKVWVEYMTAHRLYVVGKSEVAPPVPEGMPEDMVASAKAGLTLVLLNKEQVQGCQDAFKATYRDNGKESPLNQPDKFLLQINRTEDLSKGIPGSNKFATKSVVKFIKISSDVWTMAQIKPLIEYVSVAVYRNIYNLQLLNPEKNSTADKVAALKNITAEELEEYLQERNFSYIAKAQADGEEEEEDEDEAPSTASRPKARIKDAPTLDEDQEKELASLRANLFK